MNLPGVIIFTLGVIALAFLIVGKWRASRDKQFRP